MSTDIENQQDNGDQNDYDDCDDVSTFFSE